MIEVVDAMPSGRGNPVISRNGKSTVCQYACFSQNNEQNSSQHKQKKAPTKGEALIQQIREQISLTKAEQQIQSLGMEDDLQRVKQSFVDYKLMKHVTEELTALE